MLGYEFATNVKNFVGTNGVETTFLLENGEPILVWGFIASPAGTVGTVTLKDKDDNTLLVCPMSNVVSAMNETKFMADNGLKVVLSSTPVALHCAIFYSQLGG